MMNKKKINALKVRIDRLESRGDKNLKCGGVLRKLKRKLLKLEQI